MESGTPEAPGVDETALAVQGCPEAMKTALEALGAALFRQFFGASPDAVRQNIAGLDGLRIELKSDNWLPWELMGSTASPGSSQASIDAQSPVSWYSGGAITTTTYAGSWSTALPSAAAPTTIPVARFAVPTVRSWFSSPGPTFPAANPLSSDKLISFIAAATSAVGELVAELDSSVQFSTEPALQRDLLPLSLALFARTGASEPVASTPGGPTSGIVLVIREARLQKFRENLLRLVDGIRAALCLMLMLILSTLSRRLDALSFVLILLATSRRFGRRSDPGDHAFPALTPVPVVIGEVACS